MTYFFQVLVRQPGTEVSPGFTYNPLCSIKFVQNQYRIIENDQLLNENLRGAQLGDDSARLLSGDSFVPCHHCAIPPLSNFPYLKTAENITGMSDDDFDVELLALAGDGERRRKKRQNSSSGKSPLAKRRKSE